MLYKGQLTLHHEMCSGVWIQFHDYRGLHGEQGQYWSWDWTINFDKKTHFENIKIYNESGDIIYNGSWTYSHHDRIYMYPKEIDEEQWRVIINKQYHCEIETHIKVKALGGSYDN